MLGAGEGKRQEEEELFVSLDVLRTGYFFPLFWASQGGVDLCAQRMLSARSPPAGALPVLLTFQRLFGL